MTFGTTRRPSWLTQQPVYTSNHRVNCCTTSASVPSYWHSLTRGYILTQIYRNLDSYLYYIALIIFVISIYYSKTEKEKQIYKRTSRITHGWETVLGIILYFWSIIFPNLSSSHCKTNKNTTNRNNISMKDTVKLKHTTYTYKCFS
jgi:hypothetical protein